MSNTELPAEIKNIVELESTFNKTLSILNEQRTLLCKQQEVIINIQTNLLNDMHKLSTAKEQFLISQINQLKASEVPADSALLTSTPTTPTSTTRVDNLA